MSESAPRCTVIVPAYNGASVLPATLEALANSDMARDTWELLVVDDGSTDETAAIAAEWADAIVRLPGPPHGPAYARNRGAEAAAGEIVVFVDADVRVHPDAIRRLVETFEHDAGVDAVFGSYDANPHAPGLVSQYRNLLHHYHHHANAGEAETFWAGLGAVRRAAFLGVHGFDAWHYRRPSIEDIELGHRLRLAGHRIRLDPTIQCTHLKHWRLYGMLRTDLFDRGVPWVQLLLQEGRLGTMRALNLRRREKVNTACAGLALASLLALPWAGPEWTWLPLVLLLPIVVTNLPLYRFFRRQRGLWFALAVLPLHLAYYVLNGFAVVFGWLLHHVVGEPAPAEVVQAYAEVKLQRWPPVPGPPEGSPWSGTRAAPPEIAPAPSHVAGSEAARDIP